MGGEHVGTWHVSEMVGLIDLLACSALSFASHTAYYIHVTQYDTIIPFYCYH